MEVAGHRVPAEGQRRAVGRGLADDQLLEAPIDIAAVFEGLEPVLESRNRPEQVGTGSGAARDQQAAALGAAEERLEPCQRTYHYSERMGADEKLQPSCVCEALLVGWQ